MLPIAKLLAACEYFTGCQQPYPKTDWEEWDYSFIYFFIFFIEIWDFVKDMTQFEIERRSYGQSMANSRFFSGGSQNNSTGCHFFYVPCKKLTKKLRKKNV